MTDEDLRWCDVCDDCSHYKAVGDEKYQCTLEGGRCRGYFAYKKLKSENAALREQISKMVMPPCTLGETLYITSFCFGDGYDEAENATHTSGWQITETKVDEKNFYHMCDLIRNEIAFFSREAAEASLAELKGENRGKER